jgi:hypothetical protein
MEFKNYDLFGCYDRVLPYLMTQSVMQRSYAFKRQGKFMEENVQVYLKFLVIRLVVQKSCTPKLPWRQRQQPG